MISIQPRSRPAAGTPSPAAGPKTIYLSRMSDHVVAITGALSYHGIPTKVLAPSDDETLAIGLGLCRGRECLPCFLCVGDMIRECRRGWMARYTAASPMPASMAPCSAGQYRLLQWTVLDSNGFEDVESLSPTSETS